MKQKLTQFFDAFPQQLIAETLVSLAREQVRERFLAAARENMTFKEALDRSRKEFEVFLRKRLAGNGMDPRLIARMSDALFDIATQYISTDLQKAFE